VGGGRRARRPRAPRRDATRPHRSDAALRSGGDHVRRAPGGLAAFGDGLVALVEASGSAQLVPDLATAVPLPTDGGRTYGFRLRPGLRYSTGLRVRASDLRRQLERLYAAHSPNAAIYGALRGTAACEHRPAACDLSRGVVTDDRAGTIALHLTHPDPDLLYKLTLPFAPPVPPGTPRERPATGPIPSTGPYRLARFEPGRGLLLVRNVRFREWSRAAQPDGYADRIDVRFDDEPEDRVAAVLHGDADVAVEIADADLAPLRTRFASQLRRHAQPNTSFLSFNVRRPRSTTCAPAAASTSPSTGSGTGRLSAIPTRARAGYPGRTNTRLPGLP
jgi:peptide/nickel transport system substrate-binding protein